MHSPDGDRHEHDLGLQHDLSKLMGRRQVLGLLAGAGIVSLAACTSSAQKSSSTTSSTATASSSDATSTSGSSSASASASTTTAADCDTEIPDETAGPFPGDGSNGPDALTASGVVRQDIRRSFGPASGVAKGVLTNVELTVVDASDGCSPLAGAAIYLWHCDAQGNYSMYDGDAVNENYLRGVQKADAYGVVRFTTIFPAAYDGRWPHMHFEVYPSLAQATSAGTKAKTSQLALPADVCSQVYARSEYSGSAQNLARTSLRSDMVFGDDGAAHQLATVTGSISSGLKAALVVPV